MGANTSAHPTSTVEGMPSGSKPFLASRALRVRRTVPLVKCTRGSEGSESGNATGGRIYESSTVEFGEIFSRKM